MQVLGHTTDLLTQSLPFSLIPRRVVCPLEVESTIG